MSTHNKHFSHNKHTLFALTKMCLFGEEEDFGKINSLYFLKIESLKTHFVLFLKNYVNYIIFMHYAGLNLFFLAIFCPHFQELIQE